jgi:hypothetical protein
MFQALSERPGLGQNCSDQSLLPQLDPQLDPEEQLDPDEQLDPEEQLDAEEQLDPPAS